MTLIVARLAYDANEQDLEREFGRFGAIERVCAADHPQCRISTNCDIDPHRQGHPPG